MVSLGALLLGMVQMNLWLPLLAAVAAVSSLYLTDHLGWLRLPRQLANLIAVAAVAVAIVDLQVRETEFKLIAIANLLIYLQCVQLFQEKQPRTYWQLVALSFLQVVVASALNLSMEYAFILAVYCLAGISTLLLVFVHQESLPFCAPALASTGPRGEPRGVESPADSRGELPARGRATVTLIASEPDDKPAMAMLNRPLVAQMLLITLGTFVCSSVIFLFFPRFTNSGWQSSAEDVRLTGFSREVSLNEIGRLLESPEVVMRVKFYDPDTRTPYTVLDEPYFRGSVLTRYSQFRGHWSDQGLKANRLPFRRIDQPAPLGDMVRQEISLQPQRSKFLFAVTPAYEIGGTPNEVSWDPATHVLMRDELTGDLYRYLLDTSDFLDGRHVGVTPVRHRHVPRGNASRVFLDEANERALEAKVDEILSAAGVSDQDAYACATALERHLRVSGEYRYSLVAEEKTSPDRDPVVEFVNTTKTGHCEYFASALTLMLRTKGIPARMVLGYKGAEFNSVGEYYQVRELHTHTWVEAFLRTDQLPDTIPTPSGSDIAGVWLQLDGTPTGDEAELEAGSTLWEQMREFRDYMQLLWNDYVLGLDSERQREAIYGPLVRQVKALFSREAWSESYFLRTLTHRGNWFSWRAGVAVLLLGAALVLLYRLLSRLLTVLAPRLRERRRQRQLWRARQVEFYLRLEKILARHGMRRPPGQTQREFAQQAINHIPMFPAVTVLTSVTEAFYRVRFGGEHLEKEETHQLEQSLAQLERELTASTAGDAPV
jgi:transglutaminase-like putative cysteine protease